MRLEWLLWDWEDDSSDETDAYKGVAMPFAWELIDLDTDSSARPSEQIRVKRRRGRVMQWLSGGGKFEGDALGKVVGAFDDPEEAKKAVEEAVRDAHEKAGKTVAKKTSKTEGTETPKPTGVDEYTIEEIAEEVAEKLQLVVMRIEATFAPKLNEAPPEEYPTVDGELHRETRSLPTKLTDEEVDELGTELAENVAKIDVVNALMTVLRDGLKPTLKGLESRMNALSGLVRRRERTDTVPCAHVLASDASKVEIIRLDTGVAVETRKPKKGEGQTRLGGT